MIEGYCSCCFSSMEQMFWGLNGCLLVFKQLFKVLSWVFVFIFLYLGGVCFVIFFFKRLAFLRLITIKFK